APNAWIWFPGERVKLTQTLFGPTAIEGWSPNLVWRSATFVKELPPSLESATRTSPLVLTRYVIQRFPKRSQASCWSQQISPSGSPAAPITRRVHVWPSLKDTPTASPATTSGSVDIATTFEGLVGLTAIACSASLPGMAVTLKFEGGAAAASVAVANATANPSTIAEDVEMRNRLRICSPLSLNPECGIVAPSRRDSQTAIGVIDVHVRAVTGQTDGVNGPLGQPPPETSALATGRSPARNTARLERRRADQEFDLRAGPGVRRSQDRRACSQSNSEPRCVRDCSSS